MTVVSRSGKRGAIGVDRLDADDAFIALLIGAMDASGHVSAEEAARAHDIIWSMRRFRHRSGETVGRKIERMRSSSRSRALRRSSKRRRGRSRHASDDLPWPSRRISCSSMAGWSAWKADFSGSSLPIFALIGERPRTSWT